jgi:hypothetical protein
MLFESRTCCCAKKLSKSGRSNLEHARKSACRHAGEIEGSF